MRSVMQKNGQNQPESQWSPNSWFPFGSGGCKQAQDDASKNERGFAHEQVAEHCVVWQHG